MTPLRETLERLARACPERFRRLAMDGYFAVRLGPEVANDIFRLSPRFGRQSQALLAAALQEVVEERGWGWSRGTFGVVFIYPPLVPLSDEPYEPLARAEPEGQPFALVLARAVVDALEGGRG